MVFNYNTLKQAAKEGSRLGKWKDLPVFSCSKSELIRKGNGAYYVVYDDKNAFVKKTADTWFRYGYLDQSGSVHEESSRSYFPQPKTASFEYDGKKAEVKYSEPAKAQTMTYTAEAIPQDSAPGPMADVKMELDVEATLKKAREMSIEDLLKGFNYGL